MTGTAWTSQFLLTGTTGPRVEIRRRYGLWPSVTADGKPLRAKWTLRAFAPLLWAAAFALFLVSQSGSVEDIAVIGALGAGLFVLSLPWSGTYKVPLYDGSSKALRLKGSRRGIRAVVDREEVAVERPLTPLEVAISYLPYIALLAAIWIAFLPLERQIPLARRRRSWHRPCRSSRLRAVNG